MRNLNAPYKKSGYSIKEIKTLFVSAEWPTFLLQKAFLKFEPKSESEENTVAVKITEDMTPDDLANTILREVNKQ